MNARSVAGSVTVMMGLLITVGLASRAHPFSPGDSPGSRRTTDLLIVAASALAAALIVALAAESHRPGSRARRPFGVGDVLFALALVAAIAAGSYGLGRLFHRTHSSPPHGVSCVKFEQAHGKPISNCVDSALPSVAKGARHARRGRSPYPWVAIGAVVVLLSGGGAALAVERRRRARLLRENDDDGRGAIVEAVDLAIDDLRHEPDARRAIIAAYARMETAFAAVGLPRQPAEAPHEFLVRSLRTLDASAEAASRLTALFEFAKFGHHPTTLAMRDEAVDALLATREELIEPRRA
jgi:Domain of unknown function (DUF4129)